MHRSRRMVNLDFVLTVLAVILFALAAGNAKIGQVNLFYAGIAVLTLTLLV